ncbi:primosomal protein N' [Methylolobus aquaticus]|nr:primosomal protein N' [Methylolobus aquaticus]
MTTIWRIAVPVPLYRVFDYLPIPGSPTPQPGCRIRVPFGRQSQVGCLLDIVDGSDIEPTRLKTAAAVLDESPLLRAEDLGLLTWAARYYHHPLGEVLLTAFPVLLRKGRAPMVASLKYLALTEKGTTAPLDTLSRAPRQALLLRTLHEANGHRLAESALTAALPGWRRAAPALIAKGLACHCEQPDDYAWASSPEGVRSHPDPKLNPAQVAAVNAVAETFGRSATFLLEGVTGSGKTEVYLSLVRRVMERGEQCLLLLPEISLTPQIEQRFVNGLGRSVPVFHSRLSELERLQSWMALQSGAAPILLGTRSAVFCPMQRPGLIIVDEEHEASYKQQDGFRFSARDVAIKRARDLGVPIVLGSATPSLESLWNAERQRYRRLRLPDRAGGAAAPPLRLVDVRRQRLVEGLSRRLIDAIDGTLSEGHQALLFINRRGYAPTLICNDCGWVAECRTCDARLVIHQRENRLRCHHCAYEQAVPRGCPSCGGRDLRPLGMGTERIEQALEELFPAARLTRIDRDSTATSGSLQEKLADVHSGDVDILIGTQMLAKGHHFPRVTLVGIVDADAMLFATDFRASERMAQLIVQVAGRAGRAEKPGTVLLQTRNPEHPLLQTLIDQGYPGFATLALEERRAAGLPPFGHLAVWRAEAIDGEVPQRFLTRLREHALACCGHGIEVLGPAPAPMLRQSGRHRYQLLLQSGERPALHAVLDQLQPHLTGLTRACNVRWSLDVDPIDCY